MSELNLNNPIPCTYCRYYPVRSRTRELSRAQDHVILEHQWICPKCGNVARSDKQRKQIK